MIAWRVILLALILALAACASMAPQNVTPRDIATLHSEAARAYTAGRWDQAAALYAQLAEKVPQDGETLLRLGNSLAQLGRWDLAAQAYTQSLTQEPQNAKAAYDLAVARLAQAQEAARWAVQAAPEASLLQERARHAADLLQHAQKDLEQPNSQGAQP